MKTTTTHFLAFSIFLGLFTSNIQAQWTAVNNGLASTTVTGIANVRDTLFTAVKDIGVFYSTNNGNNWTEWSKNDQLITKNITKLEGISLFIPNTLQKVFYIYGPSMLHFYLSDTDNNGNSGSTLLTIPVPAETINTWINESNLNNTDTEYYFIGTNNGVYYSTDDGANWTKSTGLTGDALLVNDINLYDYDDDTEKVFISTNNGVYFSNDNGVSFVPHTNGITSGIKVYDQTLFVPTSNGVYYYDDETDSYISFISEGDFRTTILNYGTFIAYAFGNGVAKKINLTNSVITDLSQENITGGKIISATLANEYIFITTENGGVFRMPQNTLSTDNFTTVNEYFNVYPNPSNGQITINTKNPSSFDLFSIKGNHLKSFKVENTESFSLNLASGVYLIKEKNTHIVKRLVIR